ncbi:MAG: DUF3231 family protein [Bacillus sp. (in: Bacteria)]|uniref:DUF3231 family protein n=1 Tax=Niallia circulans TaxID=1397 RepID=A0A941GB35_NIACI|nr:DUF3231 family protein [Niallia circulans]MBQ6446197.1 DUF3231 family protein [Bacillus sp. (in: firmicutes)]MCB5237965.1 DUF3231 family protein [Niallia circulans]
MKQKEIITSSELATLWMTYQEKTMFLRMVEYFHAVSEGKKEQNFYESHLNKLAKEIKKIEAILQAEGAVVPNGFSEQDVNKQAPPLFQPTFALQIMRMLAEIGMGLHAIHLARSYRKDIIRLFQELSATTQHCYEECTELLIEKGALSCPPQVSMPEQVDMVVNTQYLKGTNIFGNKRVLNTVEVSFLYQSIESNSIGQQLITGFAQVTKDPELKKFFTQGKELSKKIITKLSKKLMDDDIQIPLAWVGSPTVSTIAPFSDKLMLYCISLFCSFGLGSNAIGTTFSLRKDLSATLIPLITNIYDYGVQGAELMAKKGYTEEPPGMENRKNIINKK